MPVRAIKRRRLGAGAAMGVGLVALLLVALLVSQLGLLGGRGPGTARAPAPVGAWRSLPDLASVRGQTSGVRLGDGSVIVAGGGVGSLPVAAAEIFDPARGAWTAVGALHQPRRGHALVVLGDGRVLAAGGVAGSQVLASAEVYDPATRSWTEVGRMRVGRFGHTLNVLSDGRVLAAGGTADGSHAEGSAELFDPRAATWTTTGSLIAPRYDARGVTLKDGRVLVAGGAPDATGSAAALESAELFDPAVGVFTRTAAMSRPRQDPAAALLGDGRVLVAGGSSGDASTASAEAFDPVAGSWKTLPAMADGRRLAGVSSLADGRVLVAGGESIQGGARTSVKSAEIFDPAAGGWRPAAALACPRSGLAQVTLRDGAVLAAGGDAAFPGQPPRAQSCAELFHP